MKTQTSKTAAVMGLLSRGTSPAPVQTGGITTAPAERTIEEITADILQAKQAGGEAVLAIGRGLIEAKGVLPHGEWLPWLSEKVEFSERTAQNFMRLAREWSNPQALADLGAAKALTLLALPEAERESFVAEANVVDMTSRELEKAVRERAEALEAKSKAEAALARAQAEAESAAADSIAARKELDELKARPVEVAVEVDKEALAKARAEGAASTAKKIVALEDKLAKAEKDRKAAEDELSSAKAELVSARKQLAVPSQPEDPSPLSTDADLAQFKLLFEQAQGIVNQLHGLLLRARKREDGSVAEKLESALAALGEKVRGCVQ